MPRWVIVVGRVALITPAIVTLGLLSFLSFLYPAIRMRSPLRFVLAGVFAVTAIVALSLPSRATPTAIFVLVNLLGALAFYFALLPEWLRWASPQTAASPTASAGPSVTAPATATTAVSSSGGGPGQEQAADLESWVPRDDPVVFISHAASDGAFADALSLALQAEAIRTWRASRDVQVGANYAESIVKAVYQAQWLVVILSPEGIASPHVRREVSIAIDRNVPILPISVDPTGELMATLPVDWTYWLSLAQVVRASDAAGTASEIARRLRLGA